VREIIRRMAAACLFVLAADTSIAQTVIPKAQATTPTLSGIASVYSYKNHTRTASGESINPTSMVAAHRTLRFGTQVRVTNRRNGKSVVVRIIDRGPFIRGRIIDLSPAAAREIGLGWGVAPVTLAVVGNRA
jgi:rare lipoprotein A